MYFNLKDGVSEEEFTKKSKELWGHVEANVEGLGFPKLYRHHGFGANRRTYQMHLEFKDFGTWDRFSAFKEKDEKSAKLLDEWHDLAS